MKHTGRLTENISELADYIVKEMPVHSKIMNAALENLSNVDIRLLDEYINFCRQRGVEIKTLGESYLTIVEDTFNEQLYFKKNGKYRYASFAEVADSVYFNDEYMSLYMYGLALTSFLWPNHIEIKRFFEKTLPKDAHGRYLEIGPGHGYFMMKAMQESAYEQFLGVDISETSIKMTSDIIHNYCPDKDGQYKLMLSDFLTAKDLEPDSFDAVVMGEVLEHVEQPDIFMKRIHELAKKDAYIFVTTCCNAPAIDHIFLFNNHMEVEKMFTDCGFAPCQSLILPYEGLSLDETMEKKLAVNVAYVLRKL